MHFVVLLCGLVEQFYDMEVHVVNIYISIYMYAYVCTSASKNRGYIEILRTLSALVRPPIVFIRIS